MGRSVNLLLDYIVVLFTSTIKIMVPRTGIEPVRGSLPEGF